MSTTEPIVYSTSDTLTADEYLAFLDTTDLGGEYPPFDFRARIETLLASVDIRVTARNDRGTLVGVCLGLTDFAYFLFLTDLGVAREYERRGIGRELVRLTHEAAGGEERISILTWTNPGVLGFYEACDMPRIFAVGRGARELKET